MNKPPPPQALPTIQYNVADAMRLELAEEQGRHVRLRHAFITLLDTLDGLSNPDDGLDWTETDRAEFEALAGIKK